MELSVLKTDGTDSGKKVSLKPEIFGVEPNEHAIYQAVRLQRANERQGTHKTKGRSEVSGGGKKPFKQKGTGNARQGTIRAPHMTGGGRVFGPEPRDYGFKLNRKLKLLARRSAYALKASSESLIVMEDFTFDVPKTKRIVDILKSTNQQGKRVLILTAGNDINVYKSARNIYKADVKEARNASVYDVMNASVVICQEGAIEVLNEVLG
jgi:large subunit ribosomal protein L4